MAAHAAVEAQHGTLAGAAADSVTFSGSGQKLVVTNHDAALLIYFRQDGVTAVAAADETYVVRPGAQRTVDWGGGVVSLIGSGAGTNPFSVEII